MCGIFEQCAFLNEKGAFKAKREIKNSEEYKKMQDLIKDYKKEKDPKIKEELRKQALIVLDECIKEVNQLPDDGIFENVARNFINIFKDPLNYLGAIFGFVFLDFSGCPTRNDFLKKLYSIRKKLAK